MLDIKQERLTRPILEGVLAERVLDLYAQHTGRTRDQIELDIDRDRFMSAEEAKEYGIIDKVIQRQSELEGMKSA